MASRPKAEIELTARNRVNEAVDAANRSLSGLGRTAQFVTLTLGALGALQIGKRFLETADQAQTLENRLRLVTHSSHQLAVVQNELFRIAQETNSSFAGTIELYSRMARATADVGISQERLLNVTRTINQAMLVSGASAEEAERALVQLSQGLAAGALRGQDLNSVISQTPRLAQAIAEGMGMAFGQLKTAAEQGQLSTEAVIRALEDQAETIRREYGQMEATVGQSVTNVGNSMVRLVGKIDEAIGASDRLRSLLDLVSRGIDKLGDVVEPEDPLSAKIKEQIALIERLEQGLENLRRRPGTPEAAIAEQERRIANLKADLQVLQEAQRWMEERGETARRAEQRLADLIASSSLTISHLTVAASLLRDIAGHD